MWILLGLRGRIISTLEIFSCSGSVGKHLIATTGHSGYVRFWDIRYGCYFGVWIDIWVFYFTTWSMFLKFLTEP